ncbi:MAG: DNA adenine methylase [Imperialibacter sp.]|uniref:DNA adenine methylase n=1 Tax=Imperialibacter sp. TaxID=2038411 RepID=UPI0032EF3522
MDVRQKTPITYYGGKQSMLGEILPRIPSHKVYVEPFIGGAAVFFSKEPAPLEVINDLNSHVTNFYFCMKAHFQELQELVQSTPHARQAYEDARVMYRHPHLFDRVQRAWAFWTLTNMGFAGKIGSWGYDKKEKGKVGVTLNNKRLAFSADLARRLDTTQIECEDAVKVLTVRDSQDTFHYCDPPYIDTNCGHYGGYTAADFEALLAALSEVKGKFLLSSFSSELLDKYTSLCGWSRVKITKNCSASKDKKGVKVEVLTANYRI